MNSSFGDVDRESTTGDLVKVINDLRSRLDESEKKRRHAEDTLVNIGMFNLSVLDSLPAHIAVLDESGNIIYVNKSWIRFAHENGAYSDESIGIGMNYFSVCENADGDRSCEAASALMGMQSVIKGELEHFEILYPCHSPTAERWFLGYTTPYTDLRKRCIVTTHIDVTAMVAAQKALDMAKKQNELYVDLISHDINNMNQSALGYLELAKGAQDLEDSKQMISKSVDSILNSSRLIDTVRKLQKQASDSLIKHKIDVCDILQGLKEQYSSVPGRQVTIDFSKISRCYVMANDLLVDVFSNLITNSIKHSDAGKSLDIDINVTLFEEASREYYLVTIEDNGPGIPDTLKQNLFNRLRRGDTKSYGRGLGLYLVKTLVEGYDGRVWVEDRVPEDYTKGARFVVVLPKAEK